jgi:hypothetical protein
VPAALAATQQPALAQRGNRPTDVPRSGAVRREANFNGVKPLAPSARGDGPPVELLKDVALEQHATAALGAVVGHEQNLPLPES